MGAFRRETAEVWCFSKGQAEASSAYWVLTFALRKKQITIPYIHDRQAMIDPDRKPIAAKEKL